MSKKYNFKVTKTYHYYGAPAAEYHWMIEGEYFTVKIKYFGNQGFDFPSITVNGRKHNGYFWSLNALLSWLFGPNAMNELRTIRLNETKNIEV